MKQRFLRIFIQFRRGIAAFKCCTSIIIYHRNNPKIYLVHNLSLVQNHHGWGWLRDLLLSPRMLSPVPLDIVMAILGHHQRSLLIIVPGHTSQPVRVVLDRLKVGLGEELVVEDPLGEGEPVPLLLPQPDLVRDGGGDDGGHRVGGQHVHLQEPDDLVGCDASSIQHGAIN